MVDSDLLFDRAGSLNEDEGDSVLDGGGDTSGDELSFEPDLWLNESRFQDGLRIVDAVEVKEVLLCCLLV